LEGCGLDGLAARHWGARLHAELAERPWRSGETPVTRLAEVMGGELRCAARVDGGEVHVILGGSGAGKSSLVVKLALRERLLHGRVPLLISLDHARPEGAALLRRYAEVFGLPLHRVSRPAEIASVIDRLGDDRPCFIDAPATAVDADSQPQVSEWLCVLPERTACHLLLPAATSLPEMRRQVAAHTALGIDRLAFSKIDEASHFGQVIAIAAESDLPVSWLTNGRQIPEDLVDASRDLLCALMTRRGDETPLAPTPSAWNAKTVHEHTEAGNPARSSSDCLGTPISATA
jgi:flagellar biosynthesis GTPase FlhF